VIANDTKGCSALRHDSYFEFWRYVRYRAGQYIARLLSTAFRHRTNIEPGLMATRFLLGSFEACVAPTFIAIVQMWYRRGEQTVRNAAWYAQLGVVNIVSL
jgi:hypothetical protein